jgi:hypothetical protein
MRFGTVATLIAFAFLSGLGCASLPPCPERGGPAWSLWRSTHFDVVTDLPAADAEAALQTFEGLRSAVQLAMWRRAPEPRGRIEVFVLRDSRELRVFLPSDVGAAFVARPGLHQAYFIKSGTDHDVLATEGLVLALAHHYGLAGKVAWFDRGLASYLGPLDLKPDGTLTYGQLDMQLYKAAALGYKAPFAQLWEPRSEQNKGTYDVTCWLALSYLINREPERFEDFQRRLVATNDGRAAWRAAFPDVTDEDMDDRLLEYLNVNRAGYSTFKTRVPSVAYTRTVTPLPDARVHALRALLYATAPPPPGGPPRADLVRAELAEALRGDRDESMALLLERLYLREREDDLAAPKRIIALRPNDALAWVALAHARLVRNERAEADEAWEQVRALTEGPDEPVGLDARIARPD